MRTLEEIARAVGGRLEGPADLVVHGLAPPGRAGSEDLTFTKDERNALLLASSRAGAVLCRDGVDVGGRPAVRVENPRLAAAIALRLLAPEAAPVPGRHPTCWIAPDARVPASCTVGAFAVVEAGADLGEGVVLGPHAVVGSGARVGEATRLDARVVLYPGVRVGARCRLHAGCVVGSPGFGYEMGPQGPVGFPQRGTVVLGDDVRVGANATIDRATFDETRLGDGVKIDNLVQVGHNVTVADGVVICALSGVGGGARFGARAVMGPQSALAPDAELGPGSVLGARSALASHQRLDDPGQVHQGVPAMPLRDWKRWVILRRRMVRVRHQAPPATGS